MHLAALRSFYGINVATVTHWRCEMDGNRLCLRVWFVSGTTARWYDLEASQLLIYLESQSQNDIIERADINAPQTQQRRA